MPKNHRPKRQPGDMCSKGLHLLTESNIRRQKDGSTGCKDCERVHRLKNREERLAIKAEVKRLYG